MAKFWAKRIGYDISRINEVPKKWREAVREIIEAVNPPEEPEPEPAEPEPETDETSTPAAAEGE